MNAHGANGPLFLADCPGRLTVELLSEKWTVVTVAALSVRPMRHHELMDSIGGVSRKVLTQTLRRLERHGLVGRRPLPGTSSHIRYELTPLGRTLIDPISAMNDWAKAHGDEVLEAMDSAPSESRSRPGQPA